MNLNMYILFGAVMLTFSIIQAAEEQLATNLENKILEKRQICDRDFTCNGIFEQIDSDNLQARRLARRRLRSYRKSGCCDSTNFITCDNCCYCHREGLINEFRTECNKIRNSFTRTFCRECQQSGCSIIQVFPDRPPPNEFLGK